MEAKSLIHPRVTHGRHCPCSACAREDWARITGPCGMHGAECPRVYAPIATTYEAPRERICVTHGTQRDISCPVCGPWIREAHRQEIREAVALAVSGDSHQAGEMVPQTVWDELHERDLVRTARDITDDAYTFTTPTGSQRLRELLGA